MSMAASDFHWMTTEEPHASRRIEILKKHPEIKELFGPEWRTIPIVFALVATQLCVGWAIQDASWPAWIFVAWAVGGTINHALFLAIHEIVHGLACKSRDLNKLVSFIANIAIGVPYASVFQYYHLEHHKYQGCDGIDTDVPTAFEARFIQGPFMKVLFCFFQILFYAGRPMMMKSPPINQWVLANWIAVGFVCSQYGMTCGLWAYLYLPVSTFCSGALHPVSGHFIAEHYEFAKGTETYSYYGPLNVLAFNVGYHNEHHDFPYIPWSRLPLVRKIAPEFYDNLPQTKSWPGTIWNFITDPTVSGFSRVKRGADEPKGRQSSKSK